MDAVAAFISGDSPQGTSTRGTGKISIKLAPKKGEITEGSRKNKPGRSPFVNSEVGYVNDRDAEHALSFVRAWLRISRRYGYFQVTKGMGRLA